MKIIFCWNFFLNCTLIQSRSFFVVLSALSFNCPPEHFLLSWGRAEGQELPAWETQVASRTPFWSTGWMNMERFTWHHGEQPLIWEAPILYNTCFINGICCRAFTSLILDIRQITRTLTQTLCLNMEVFLYRRAGEVSKKADKKTDNNL